MGDKKYILTNETIEHYGHTLHRIIAIKDFGNVHKGDFGGWVESENNLSHIGDCWIYNNGEVFDCASVSGNAIVHGNAEVRDNAKVSDNAIVRGNASIFDNAIVRDNAEVKENARIFHNVEIFGNAIVGGNAIISNDVRIYGEANIFGEVCICGDAEITSMNDYAVFKNTWSSGRYFTWTKSNNMWKVGCFYGTGEELIKKAYEESETKGECYEAIVRAQEIISNAN